MVNKKCVFLLAIWLEPGAIFIELAAAAACA